jgi:hypothetical protein
MWNPADARDRRAIPAIFAIALALGGCESTKTRCDRVWFEDLRHENYLRDLRNDISNPNHPPAAPPKPSDVEWYAEHCYEGKPR